MLEYRFTYDTGHESEELRCATSCTVAQVKEQLKAMRSLNILYLSFKGERLQDDAGLPPAPGPITCITMAMEMKQAKFLELRSDRLWEQRQFTDATVVCDGVTFSVHRAILAAASPVLHRAFSSCLHEATNLEYTVHDSTPAAAESLLRFCYTGVVSVEEESDLLPLLELAIMYEVDDLSEAVGEAMLVKVTTENIAARGKVLKRHSGASMISTWPRFLDLVGADHALIAALL